LCSIAATLASSSSETETKRRRAECEMWSKLENKTLPLQNQGHANCTTNPDCTGFSCTGIYQGKDISFGMRALPCKTPPGVEIFGYAPQYNTQHFSHIFTHKAEYEVPGALLNISMLPADGVKPGAESLIRGILEVTLRMNHDTNTLTMGLNAKACVNRTCIFNKPVFNNTEIPVPDCPNAIPTLAPEAVKVNSVCRMSDINACGPNMACNQDEAGAKHGICICLEGYSVQDDKTCLSVQEEEEELAEARLVAASLPADRTQPDTLDEVEALEATNEESARPKKSAFPASSGSAVAELPRHVTSDSDQEQRVRVETGGQSRRHQVVSGAEGERNSGAIAAVVISLLAVFVVGAASIGILMRTSYGTRLRARLTRVPYGDIAIPTAANPNTSTGVTQLGSTATLDSADNFA